MDIINKIEQLHKDGKHQEIIDILENYPSTLDYNLTCLLARAYNNVPSSLKEDFSNILKGIELLKSVEKQGKNDPLWHYRIGYGYFYTDREEEALEHFNKAVDLIPRTKEEVAKWRDFNLGYFIGECEDIIKSKEISVQFGDGSNIDENIIIDFILYNLLHKNLSEDDIITDKTLYVPEWMLIIKPVVTSFSNDKIDIEWIITCPLFDYGIKEESFGAGDNLKEAVYMAVSIFASSLLQAVDNTLAKRQDKHILYSSTFNNHDHNWNIYYNTPLISNDEDIDRHVDELYFWNIIKDKLKEYLGNQKMVCVKIYVAKFAGKVISECRIDDIYISELSDIIDELIEESNFSSNFFAIKQYFIITQQEDTRLPYKYVDKEGYIELRNNLKTICNIVHKTDLEEMSMEHQEDSLFNLLELLNEKVDDFTLCIEAIIFIPEIFASNVFDNINFPEHMMLSFNDDDAIYINYTQLADYSRINRAIWEIFDNYEDSKERDELYNKFINMSITVSGLILEGKNISESIDDELIPAFDMELNADERFEIR